MFVLLVETCDGWPIEEDTPHVVVDTATCIRKDADTAVDVVNELFESTYNFKLKGSLRLFRRPDEGSPSPAVLIPSIPIGISTKELAATFRLQQDGCCRMLCFKPAPGATHYAAVLLFQSAGCSGEFIRSRDGSCFSWTRPEALCHALPLERVLVGPSQGDLLGVELPMCLACLERLDGSASGIDAKLVTPHRNAADCNVCRTVETCPALKCRDCDAQDNIWICLICSRKGCGRYRAGHAREHALSSGHSFAMELATLRVWDYYGDRYVHRLLYKAAPAPSSAKEVISLETMPRSCAETLAAEKLHDEAPEFFAHMMMAQLGSLQEEHQRQLRTITAVYEQKVLQVARDSERTVKGKPCFRCAELEASLAEERAMSRQLLDLQGQWSARNELSQATIADLQEQLSDLTLHLEQASRIDPDAIGGTIQLVKSAPPRRRR